jgi:hypothetical protein
MTYINSFVLDSELMSSLEYTENDLAQSNLIAFIDNSFSVSCLNESLTNPENDSSLELDRTVIDGFQ